MVSEEKYPWLFETVFHVPTLRCRDSGGLRSAEGVAGKLQKDLKLPNIDTDAVDACLESEDPVTQLRNLAIEKFRQKARAEHVFELLDDSGKGCVILQDLQRVASEILDEDVSDDDLIEMVSEIDRSGDGLLQKDDFIHLAALIDL